MAKNYLNNAVLVTLFTRFIHGIIKYNIGLYKSIHVMSFNLRILMAHIHKT